MNVCVVAMGKIGLPLAVQIASKGHQVLGADISVEVIDQVNAGRPPFPGEAELGMRLRTVVDNGHLRATTDTAAAVAASEVVIIVVPLIVGSDAKPDFGALDAATADVARGLQPGTLVSYETTLPVHTTRERFAPTLAETAGLVLGEDLFVCHSPERVYSGRVFADLRRYPKLIGGIDHASALRAFEFYEAVLDFDARPDLDRANGVWDLGSVEAAELAKLAETTYRDVNIALANEFARFSDSVGIDVYAVIAAANSQPYSHVHHPGIAVGGHCIPVYPQFYLSNHPEAAIPATARRVNDAMPRYAVRMLFDALGDLEGTTVVVLGAAYRGGVKETAFSGVFPLVELLHAAGAVALVHDPLYDHDELAAIGLSAYTPGVPCDGVIVQTDHAEYADFGPGQFPGVRAIIDGRRVTDPQRWTSVTHTVIGGGGPSRGKL